MKRLILMRHAKAEPPRGIDDFDRRLAERGRLASPRAGALLKREGLLAEQVLVSAAARTRETWQLVAQSAGLAQARFEDDLYLAPASTILGFIRDVPTRTRSVLVIGHNPGLAELTLALADRQESDSASLRRAATKFPTAAIAVFDVLVPWGEVGSGDCALQRFVTPADLGGVDED